MTNKLAGNQINMYYLEQELERVGKRETHTQKRRRKT